MINTGAPAVLDHPIIDRYRLAVVGAVVLEFLADLDIIVRRSVGFFEVLDHSRKAGDVRHLDVSDSVYDRGGCYF